ncbi:MAG: hypothetical protein OSJ61_01885 [Lachnospiraceae bacterium]|nr:hypothetical protein [Lachnospiraceae bacterium]
MKKMLSEQQHSELIQIIKDLLYVLRSMTPSYFISKHIREANDWLTFLIDHVDVEELQSLEKEIVDRYTFEYDVLIDYSIYEKKRHNLIRMLLKKMGLYLH